MLPRLTRRYVYDGIQRLLHWWIASLTVGLIGTGLLGSYQEAGAGRAYTWDMHMSLGTWLIVGVSGRVVWGLIGPFHARFLRFLGISTWKNAAASLIPPRVLSADGAFGHHPQASLSYLLFYSLILVMCLSGLGLSAAIHGQGPLAAQFADDLASVDTIRQIHTWSMWVIAAFVILHIGALLFHEWRDKIPLAQSMVSGYQYRSMQENGDEKHP